MFNILRYGNTRVGFSVLFLTVSHVFHADYRSISLDVKLRKMNLYKIANIPDWEKPVSLIPIQFTVLLRAGYSVPNRHISVGTIEV